MSRLEALLSSDYILADAAVVFQVIHWIVWFYGYIRPSKDPKEQDVRFYISKSLYFMAISSAQLQVLQGCPFMPAVLGGGNTFVWRDLTYRSAMTIATSEFFRRIYLIEIAYHTISTITSVMPGNRTKIEVSIHRDATTAFFNLTMKLFHLFIWHVQCTDYHFSLHFEIRCSFTTW